MQQKYNIKNFSRNLRNIRNQKDKTQCEVAVNIGINPRNYQRLETNNPPNIKMSTLVNLLKYFDVSLEELLK